MQVGGDVAELAVLIIMMVQDSDQDLNAKMQVAQAQMKAKQSLRALLDEMDQLQMQLLGQQGQEGSDCVCINSQQLASVITQLNNQLDSDNEVSEVMSM